MSTPTEDNSKNEKTILEICKTWFLNSPTHGIRRISRANSTVGRLLWSFIFLICATLMSVFISTVIMKFIAHPTKISLKVRQYRDVDHIPTVTFCNLNPLRNQSFLNENSNCNRSTCTDKERYQYFIQYMSQFLAENINNSQSIAIPLGYQLNELLIRCTFNNRDCQTNFSPFFYPNYGNCYTFNHGMIHENFGRRNISRVSPIENEYFGDSYKLSLELFLYANEYIPFIEERTAFRMYIHRPNEIPILSSNTLFLAPTTFTKLIYSQRMITFSRNCRTDLTEDMKTILNCNNTRYSQALCLKLCEFRFIEKRCRCADPLLMIFIRFFSVNRTIPINTGRLCSFNYTCHKHRNHFDSKLDCPDCLPECELIQYTIQTSYADYPNTRSVDAVYQRVEKHLTIVKPETQTNTSACVNNRKDVLLDNIVAVEISASPYATEVLAESPMYTWVDLISSIGGQAGLWIGISLISFVEWGELVCLLFCHGMRKIYRKLQNEWKSWMGRHSERNLAVDP